MGHGRWNAWPRTRANALSSRCRLRVYASPANLTKKQTQQLKSYGGSSVSGLSSSLVFTPVQGLELVNPELAAKKAKEANERYFGSTVFQKLAPTPTPVPKVGKDGFAIPSAVVRK